MTTAVISLIVAAIAVARFSRWFHRDEDMGFVSSQWLSEYRQDHESNR